MKTKKSKSDRVETGTTASAPPATQQKISTVGKPVGGTLNTLRILRYAIEHPEPRTATEISRSLGINPSTCFNIIQTLVGEEFLEAVPNSKRYTIGAALTSLAHRLTARTRDFSPALPAMQGIADRYHATVTLWARHSPTRMELLLVATSNTAVNIQMPIGQRLPLLVGGMGRIMALEGGLTDEQRSAMFAEVSWQRPLSLSTLMAQARQAQRQGWGIDDGYMNRSVTAIAVPVRIHDKTSAEPVEYVCSATMFRHQYARVALEDIAIALQGAAEQLAGIARGNR